MRATLDHVAILPRLPQRGEIVFAQALNQGLQKTYFGGCSLNIAATAAKLGLTVSVACTAGDDFESSGYAAHLRALNVDTQWILKLEHQPSAHCFSLYDQEGDCIALMDALDRTRSYDLTPAGKALDSC